MKISTISNADLKSIISEYLPEKKAVKTPAAELKNIFQIFGELLRFFRFRTTVEGLFLAFEQLSYPILVLEPMDNVNTEAPYRATNARVIYIGIDIEALNGLKVLSKMLRDPRHPLSADAKVIYDDLFKKMI